MESVNATDGVVRSIILDAGTGIRKLGYELEQKETEIVLLLTHTHWDHIQGFPFFAPLFVPGSRITVCGPEGSARSLREVLAGQMEFTYFPVDIAQLPATITFRELGEGTHEMGNARILAQYLHHPAMTLGYRIEADGASAVYLCDHEPFAETLSHDSAGVHDDASLASIVHEGDRRHARFMRDASLVVHDAQYTPEEYPAKKNWGHSTYEYAVDLAGTANVRQLVLTHHDPAHDDDFVVEIEGRAQRYAAQRGYSMSVCCAYEGLELKLEPHGTRHLTDVAAALLPTGREARRGNRVLVVDDDPDIRALASVALTQDGHVVSEASSGREALALIDAQAPDLLVLDLLMPGQGGLDVLKILRASPVTAALPVVVLTAMDDEANTRAGFELGATDYVTKPFTIPQLAARVRACLTRSEIPR